MTKLLVQLPTPCGPRTFITSELNQEDAPLVRATLEAVGARCAAVPGGSRASLAEHMARHRRARKRAGVRAPQDPKVISIRSKK